MIPPKTLRGLGVLRSLRGAGKQSLAPHAAYMKITSLELEKLRLGKAREHARRRMREIDGRLQELEQLKAAILEKMNAPAQAPAARTAGVPAGSGARRGLGTSASGKVRLRY